MEFLQKAGTCVPNRSKVHEVVSSPTGCISYLQDCNRDDRLLTTLLGHCQVPAILGSEDSTLNKTNIGPALKVLMLWWVKTQDKYRNQEYPYQLISRTASAVKKV